MPMLNHTLGNMSFEILAALLLHRSFRSTCLKNALSCVFILLLKVVFFSYLKLLDTYFCLSKQREGSSLHRALKKENKNLHCFCQRSRSRKVPIKRKGPWLKLCGRFGTLALAEELLCIDLSAFKYSILQRMFSFMYIFIYKRT